MPLFNKNPPNHKESINVRIRLDSWRFVNFQPILDVLRFSYETGKKQLRIFAGFGWILQSLHDTAPNLLRCAIPWRNTAIS